jgi:DNA-binding PadR family transcriptional regulator
LTVLALLHFKPLHPYGLQRLIQQWGKDQVVNVGQRASLYRTIERLLAEDLISVRGTTRDQAYPERTEYEVTDLGRRAARDWVKAMLSTPKAEFPDFPAALSNLLLLGPDEFAEVLEQRLAVLDASVAALDASLAAEEGRGLPRIALLESEYLRAVTVAEQQWVSGVVSDLRSGKLPWSTDALTAFAAEQP